MGELFRIAYLAELALWVPLAGIVATVPGMRRWLAAPLGVSALAAAYEAYMTFVWAPTVVNPIRVDILGVMFIAGVVDFIAGLALVGPARHGAHRRHSAAAATLCLAIPLLAVLGSIGMNRDLAMVDERLDSGRKLRFEAAFRDDATQRRFYGALVPAKNPWAGYYAIEGRDDRYRHLVIADDGRCWSYHAMLYEEQGRGDAADDEFRCAAASTVTRTMLTLRRAGAGLELHAQGPGGTVVLPARRAAPPRFPLPPPSAQDQVRFVGVFSGTYENPAGHAWLVQVWLWQAGGEVWGRYIREPFKDGQIPERLGPEKIAPRCDDDCRRVTFHSGRGDVELERVSADEWRAKVAGYAQGVALRRGELQEGFDLDLAPLASAKENRRWLEAMTTVFTRRAP